MSSLLTACNFYSDRVDRLLRKFINKLKQNKIWKEEFDINDIFENLIDYLYS